MHEPGNTLKSVKDAKEAIISLMRGKLPNLIALDEKEILANLTAAGFQDETIQKALDDLCQIKKRKKGKDWLKFGEQKPQIMRYDITKASSKSLAFRPQESDTYYGLYEIVEHRKACPECQSIFMHEDRALGETVCRSCGFVIEDHARVPDWKRVNPPVDPLTVHDPYKLLIKYRSQRMRARIYAEILTREEQHLSKVLPELQRTCDHLDTPAHIRRTAAYLYLKVYRSQLIRGSDSYEPYLQATLFLAYRLYNTPNNLARSKRMLKALKKILKYAYDMHYPIQSPDIYIPYIVSRMEVKLTQSDRNRILREAVQMHRKLKDTLFPFSGKNPRLIASALIYLAARALNVQIGQERIAHAAGVSFERISKLQKRITKHQVEYLQQR